MSTAPADERPSNDPVAEARAADYARRKRYLWLLDVAISVAAPFALLFSDASSALRDLAVDGSGITPVAVLVYATVLLVGLALLTLPLDFWSDYVIEHQFELSRQSIRGWAGDWLKALGLQLSLGAAAIELIYALIRVMPGTWWLAAAAAFVLFFVLLANLAPVLILPLFYRFEPLRDENLRARLIGLTERLGTRVRGIYVWKLGEKSRKSNAALMGWGNTRRIVVTDTMLESNSPAEIEVVLAHELGHHVNRDIPRLIAFQAVLTFGGFGLVHLALSTWSEPLGFTGVADFANLPLLLLVALAASLIVLPVANGYSRRRETAADLFALETTEAPGIFIDAMTKLGRQNLAQTRPHRLIEFLLHSHPSIGRRVDFAHRWEVGR